MVDPNDESGTRLAYPALRDIALRKSMPAFGGIHFATPARDGEIALLQHDGARARNESLGLRTVAVVTSHDPLEIAEPDEGSVIDRAKRPKWFAHFIQPWRPDCGDVR